MAVNLTNRIKPLSHPGTPFPALIRDEEGLKPDGNVKAAVNYLPLMFGNRLTVPKGFWARQTVKTAAEPPTRDWRRRRPKDRGA